MNAIGDISALTDRPLDAREAIFCVYNELVARGKRPSNLDLVILANEWWGFDVGQTWDMAYRFANVR